jgi:peptidoglycan/xylan/chitin deacetylase (PgdA/CDA1 family)
MKRRVYAGAGAMAFRLGLHHLLLRRRATIAVFHRIDDALAGNPISVTRREFSDYLDFFATYFQVVSLSQLLERLVAGRPLGGLLAITFDDGYRDNHEIAAPELERRGFPATFFITTGFIETDLVPPWDANLGVRSRWMSWSQVRDLHARGFEIGAHTVTHPDLGRAPPETARGEADAGRLELETRLGAPVPDFCFPFGGRLNLTDANRDAIRGLGFRSCLSCFGGTVRGGDDPLALRRAPISPWHHRPSQWGLEVLLDRTQ